MSATCEMLYCRNPYVQIRLLHGCVTQPGLCNAVARESSENMLLKCHDNLDMNGVGMFYMCESTILFWLCPIVFYCACPEWQSI